MSDQVIPASVVARVRKLLSLAGNNSNENEASSAASKAQEIMTEFNISLSEIGQDPSASTTGDTAREKQGTGLAAAKKWQTDIMATLAANNFCAHWTEAHLSRRSNGTGWLRMRSRHFLIGRQANIVVTVETYKYLCETMERLCPYDDRRGRSSTSWFQGCTDRLVDRLGIQRQESEAASRARRQDPGRGDGSSLVLSDVYSSEEDLNNDLRYGYTPGTTGARPETEKERVKREAADRRWHEAYQRRQQKEASKVDQYAYSQGSTTGRDIGLDTQISSGGGKKALL